MKPVQVDSLTSATAAYRAALASLLDLELDEVPSYEGLAASLQFDAWLAARLNLYMIRSSDLPIPEGYWLARVQSAYLGYDTHTVVMLGTSIIWDPHPEARLMTEQFNVVQGEIAAPLDPSLPIGAEALHSTS